MKEEKGRFWFFRPGQKALPTGLCTAHLQKQSHLLVQPVPSPFSHIHPPVSLYSPYCPLACFPQCYKLRTTQTSRPKAPPWMPSKLHFLESQRLASLITPGTQDGSFTGPENTSTFRNLLLYDYSRASPLFSPPVKISSTEVTF